MRLGKRVEIILYYYRHLIIINTTTTETRIEFTTIYIMCYYYIASQTYSCSIRFSFFFLFGFGSENLTACEIDSIKNPLMPVSVEVKYHFSALSSRLTALGHDLSN